MQFSEDNQLLLTLTGGPDWTLQCWNWSKAKIVASISTSNGMPMTKCSFSPTDASVACCSGKDTPGFPLESMFAISGRVLALPARSTPCSPCPKDSWLAPRPGPSSSSLTAGFIISTELAISSEEKMVYQIDKISDLPQQQLMSGSCCLKILHMHGMNFGSFRNLKITFREGRLRNIQFHLKLIHQVLQSSHRRHVECKEKCIKHFHKRISNSPNVICTW
jgi:hypothetical protein